MRRVFLVFVVIGVLLFAQSSRYDWTHNFDYDEGVYLVSARLGRDHALFTEIFSSQPPLFLELLRPWASGTPASVLHARLFITTLSLLLVGATGLTAWLWSGELAACLAMLFLGLSARLTADGHVIQAEVPAITLCFSALPPVLRSARDPRRRWPLLAGALMAAGVLCKLLVVPMMLGFCAIAVRGRGGARRLAWIAVGGLVVATLCIARYDAHALYAQVVDFHLKKRGQVTGLQLLGVLRSDAAICALAALALVFRRNRPLHLALVMLPSVGFLAWHHPFFEHHAIVLAPLLGLGAALAVVALRERYRVAAIILGLGALAWQGWSASLEWRKEDAALISESDLATINALREVTSPEDRVISDRQYVIYVAGRLPPPQLADTSAVRLAARSLTLEGVIAHAAQAKAVVVASRRFQSLQGLDPWLATHYLHREQLGEHVMYWR